MFRLSIVIIFCTVFSLPAFALTDKQSGLPLECLHKAMSTQSMVECYKIQIDIQQKKIDNKLNRIYESKKISEQYKTQTREAQAKWLDYAKLYSASVCPSADPADCGTISRVTAAERLTTKLWRRSEEIDQQLEECKNLLSPLQKTSKTKK